MTWNKIQENGLHFLIFSALIYTIALFFEPLKTYAAIFRFFDIMIFIAPSMLLVFAIMFLMNYYIEPKKLSKFMGKKCGVEGWLIAMVAGVISTGPIYLWYPLLNDMQREGVRDGIIAAFLYSRAVKLPLLMIMVSYFGLAFTVLLNVLIFAASALQGIAVEKIMKVRI